MASKNFIEERNLEMPNVVNARLGALWDCTTSELLCCNILNKDLKPEHYTIDRSERMKNELIHVKNSMDKLKILDVKGELSLEFLSGTLNCSGSANFNDTQSTGQLEENASFYYYVEKFSVDLLVSHLKENVDDSILKKIMNGNIKATHVLKKIIYGAEIDVSIKLQHLKANKNRNINGDLSAPFKFGPIDLKVKADLKWLDEEGKDEYSKHISVYSKPAIECPKNIEEILNLGQSIQSIIQNHKYQDNKHDNLFGVPVRYLFVPIEFLFQLDIEKVYLVLKDDILDKFKAMFTTIKDLEKKYWLRIRLARLVPSANSIIFNQNSSIRNDIKQFEKLVTENMKKYFSKATAVFKEYKFGKISEGSLRELVDEFEKYLKNLDIDTVENKFYKLLSTQLTDIKYSDSQDKKITFFTNKQDSNQWYNDPSDKILLKAGGTPVYDVFTYFYYLADELIQRGFQLGVVFPYASQEFSLTFKAKSNDNQKTSEITYKEDDIIFILRMYSVAFGKCSENEKLFYKLHLEDRKMTFSTDKFSDFACVVKSMEWTKPITIANSSIQTRTLLSNNNSDSHRYVVFLSLDATDTSPKAVCFFYLLFNELKHFPETRVDWVVGKLDLDYREAPYLFVLKDSKIVQICTDYLDIIISIHAFKNGNDLTLGALLSYQGLNNTFYPSRANFSYHFKKLLGERCEPIELSMKKVEPVNKFNILCETLAYLDEKDGVIKLLDKVLEDKDLDFLWSNLRFQHLIRTNLDDQVLRFLGLNPAIDRIKELLTIEIMDQLRPYLSNSREQAIHIPSEFKDIDQLRHFLNSINEETQMEDDFYYNLTNSFNNNIEIKETLIKSGLMENWDKVENRFKNRWSFEEAKKLAIYLSNIQSKHQGDIQQNENLLTDEINNLFNHSDSKMSLHEYDTDPSVIIFDERYSDIISSDKEKLYFNQYIEISLIKQPPEILSTDLKQWTERIYNYILQKIKMWGCNKMSAQELYKLIQNPLVNENRQRFLKKGPVFASSNTIFSETKSKSINPQIPFSRLDLLTVILNSIDSLVIQDIFQVMTKFSQAIPIIIKDIRKNQQNHCEASQICLLNLLSGPIIKWEANPGQIVEYELFGSDSKFILITALRLGNKSDDLKCIGKSSILNQLFSAEFTFSSVTEPGANHGRPISLDGTVELTWLTKETCKGAMWSVVEKNYSNQFENKLILLANLHGNAIKFQDQLTLLKGITSCFLVFIMPDADESDWKSLTEFVGGEDKLHHIKVVPQGSNGQEDMVIDTQKLTVHSELDGLRAVIGEIIEDYTSKYLDEKWFDQLNLETIRVEASLKNEDSAEFMAFLKKYKCKVIRDKMILQKNKNFDEKIFTKWKGDKILKDLIQKFTKILMLPLPQRRRSLIFLEQELNKYFSIESANARSQVATLRGELNRLYEFNQEQTTVITQIKTQLNTALDNIDNMTLGLEHFYRELSKLYEIASTQNNGDISGVVQSYAELLIDGHPIELLDGDSGELPTAWFSAICQQVHKKFPDLIIFVISVIGLQSSGKSTLLNALFGCKFAVSVGRCTRGLFMRLIFLDKELADRLKIDAFIVIDTEGMGAPEKISDVDADRKDRSLATFVIGISNLAIINVLGESMKEMIEILQIASIGVARLEHADTRPDILLVQHLSESNELKMQASINQFCEALMAAYNLAQDEFLRIGPRSLEALTNLMVRVRNKDLLKVFRPFKSGASAFASPSQEYHEDVVKLYETIIDISPEKGVKFNTWFKTARDYWDNVLQENFVVRFKNIKEFNESFMRMELISNVKEAYEMALQHHIKSNIGPWLQMQANEKRARDQVYTDLEVKLKGVLSYCTLNLNDSSGSALCEMCMKATKIESELINLVDKTEHEHNTKITLKRALTKSRDFHFLALKQRFDSLLVKNECSSEIISLIDQRVKIYLGKEQLSDDEKSTAIYQIWDELVRKENDRSIRKNIKDSIHHEIKEYYNTIIDSVLKSDIGYLQTYLILNCKATKGIIRRTYRLSTSEVHSLLDFFDSLPFQILKEAEKETFHFGMVKEAKKLISERIETFENELEIDLEKKYNLDLHTYALKMFVQVMEQEQERFDKKNSPIELLKERKSYYINIIRTRLEFGYALEGDAKLIGKHLSDAIIKTASRVSNEARVQAILGMAELSNSQNVRLMYFHDLATCNNAEKVVDHFSNPKKSIEAWYKKFVKSKQMNRFIDSFKSSFSVQLRSVQENIKDITKDMAEIIEFANNYLRNAEFDSIISVSDVSNNSDDIKTFRETILDVLKELESKSNDENFERKTKLDQFQYIIPLVGDPSIDSTIMNRLGCTEYCPVCGALCWGQRDHKDDTGDTSFHHSSHQPVGLSGCGQYPTEIMDTFCCGEINSDRRWTRDRGITSMPWEEYKNKYAPKWKFQKHVNTKFDKLMRWFFGQYYEEIAKRHNLNLPTDASMREYIDLNKEKGSILAEIKSEYS